mgnify:CR=1 FL=1
MDAGRLTSQRGACDRLTDRFGTPEELAANYLEQTESLKPICASHRFAPTAITILRLRVLFLQLPHRVLRPLTSGVLSRPEIPSLSASRLSRLDSLSRSLHHTLDRHCRHIGLHLVG